MYIKKKEYGPSMTAQQVTQRTVVVLGLKKYKGSEIYNIKKENIQSLRAQELYRLPNAIRSQFACRGPFMSDKLRSKLDTICKWCYEEKERRAHL